jgi:hypothetical protein
MGSSKVSFLTAKATSHTMQGLACMDIFNPRRNVGKGFDLYHLILYTGCQDQNYRDNGIEWEVTMPMKHSDKRN